MRICNKDFTPNLIQRIQDAVIYEPKLSRRALSRRICEWQSWRAPNGKLQDMSCRKAILELNKRGIVNLPPVTKVPFFSKEVYDKKPELPEIAKVSCELEGLGKIEIVPITSRYSKASRLWNVCMKEFHYLGYRSLCGAQLRYLVRSSNFGWIGALSFSGASWHLKDRDKWIGWSDAARHANLSYIICNSRFLIFPTVRVANLASYLLSRCAILVPRDWEARYGYAPVLMETFVDPSRFFGTCYRAANWIFVGKTAGRATPANGVRRVEGKKDIYLYPLRNNWKTLLCAAPKIPLGSHPVPANPQDWVEEEFGRVEVYDNRLRERLFTLARDFHHQPGALVPQVGGGSIGKTKAAYRFFCNNRVSMETIIKPHVEATIERMKSYPVVLAVQDTTTLDYTGLPSIDGLGPTCHKKDKATGLLLHDTMAFNLEGTPLGLLDIQCWARDPKKAGKKEQRHKLPIEEKESIKWIKSYRAVSEAAKLCSQTMVVSVGDRESDIYELFDEARGDGPKLLIRAERTRKRKVGEIDLWEKMNSENVEGVTYVNIPRRTSRPARKAKLEIRYSKITLRPPVGKKKDKLSLWAVYALETGCPAGLKSPLEWMLLTTVEVSNFEEAVERLRWYSLRWGIEVYHRIIKSGCRIQDRRLNNADRLTTCLAIDLVVAWRIFLLTKRSRETPDIPCDTYIEKDEWKVLHAYFNRTSPLPDKPPSLRSAVRMIASLGGFLGRKSDGEPGTTTLWRGLQRLNDLKEAFALGLQRAGPGP